MRVIDFITLIAVLATMAVTSCKAPENITYMQGYDTGHLQNVTEQRRITVRPDDRLSIVVSSKDPELAEVFNLAIAQHRVGYDKAVNTNPQTAAFTVGPDGDITYPVLGKLHVAGLSRQQVASLISDELISKNLLKDPVVTVEFMNASVSVLGDVARPGEYPIDRDNLNILQAISKAGDLNITGLRENVLVVREADGHDIAYRIDLTDTESLMKSPAFYLQQNDVVYVEPNDTRKRQANTSGNTVFTPTF